MPFAGASGVLAYLGRHAHRVAISNGRIRSMEGRLSEKSLSNRMELYILVSKCM
jgi:hypothetical protein